jgi:hypothetical protein
VGLLQAYSSVNIVIGYGLGSQGLISGRSKIFFLYCAASRQALGSNPSPILCVLRALSPGVKREGRVAVHSPPSNTEVENGGAIPPLPRMSSWHSP